MRAWIWRFVILWMMGTAAIGSAQEPSARPAENPDQEEAAKTDGTNSDKDQGGYRTYDVLKTDQNQEETPVADETQSDVEEAIPVPIQAMEETTSLGARAYIDDVFQSPRNQWGFSLAVYQAYTTALSEGGQPSRSSGITAFTPRTFFNVGKRRQTFHIDVGAGYRRYSRSHGLDSWDYYGSVAYANQLSKRVSFQLADQFTSSYNDSWSFISIYSPIGYDPDFSNEVLFNRQRITRNALTANLGFQLTRKAQFSVFGGYNTYDYSQNSLGRSNAFEAGASFSYQIKKWLYLTNRYSTYLNQVDERFRDTRIHRLQVAGLDFRLTRSWRVWAGGGVELTDYEGENRVGESVNAGIGYTAKDTTFSVTYQRGFTSAIGISRLLSTDITSALFGYRITRWMRASVQSHYYRGSEFSSSGSLRTFSGGGGLEFALLRNLAASVNGYYQNQSTRNFSVQGLGINRITAYAGLQYFWPSRREGGYSQ